MAGKSKKDPWVRWFTVSDPLPHPNGYTVYRVKFQVFPVYSPESSKEICVWKRYSDFKKLHKTLSTLHKNLHRPGAFPNFAEPVVFGRFNSDVIEARRKSALTLLQFVGSQSHLFTSAAFELFFKGSETVQLPEHLPSDGTLLKPHVTTDAITTTAPAEASLAPSRDHLPAHSLATPTLLGPADMVAILRSEVSAQRPLSASDSRPLLVSTALPSLPGSNTDVSHDSFVEGSGRLANEDLAFFDPLVVLESGSSASLRSAVDSMRGILTVPNLAAPQGALPSLLSSDNIAKDLNVLGTSAGRERDEHAAPASRSGTLPELKKFPERSTTAHLQDGNYVSLAEAQATLAERYHAVGEHEVSVKHYECAVTLLVRGVQGDLSEQRRSWAGKKMQQYLLQAEHLTNEFLRRVRVKNGDTDDGATLPAPSLAAAHLRLGAISFDTMPSLAQGESARLVGGGLRCLRGAISELSNYKVLGIIDKVMLVLDKLTDKTFVMKVLRKNYGLDREENENDNIIPTDCPHMVSLHSYFETDSSIYLLLQHASGGKLWSYASANMRMQSSQFDSARTLSSRPDSNGNVYSGRHCSSESSKVAVGSNPPIVKVADSEQEECAKSYLDLLNETSADCDLDDIEGKTSERSSRLNDNFTLPVQNSGGNGNRVTLPARDLESPVFQSPSRDNVPFFRSDADPASAAGVDEMIHRTPRRMTARTWSVTSEELDLPPPLRRSAEKSLHIPESCVRQWAAEILTAIVKLHSLGIVCRDLRPDNVLLGDGGHVLLTFFGRWSSVRNGLHQDAIDGLYAAPEVRRAGADGWCASPLCDWWSFGAILFELLVGETLRTVHPDGIGSHTILSLPGRLSVEARDLVTQLLKSNPLERLGSGPAGKEDITAHPFFDGIDFR